jgi:hypothetical protein
MNICFLLSTNATTRTTWGRRKNASSFHNTSSIGRWKVLKQTWKTSQSKIMPLHLREVAPAMRSAQQLHHLFKEPHSSLPRCSLQQHSCLTSLIVRASYSSGPYVDKAALEKHTKPPRLQLYKTYVPGLTQISRETPSCPARWPQTHWCPSFLGPICQPRPHFHYRALLRHLHRRRAEETLRRHPAGHVPRARRERAATGRDRPGQRR